MTTHERHQLETAVAQLRHAYEQLTAASGDAWPRDKRWAFANGLISPQIRALETLIRFAEDLPDPDYGF